VLETILVGIATKLLTKLASWLFKLGVDLVDGIKFNSKVDDATKDAIENKRPSGLEDLARGL